MAFGGGFWLTENKVLPGSYINFVAAAKATATLSDRGIATIPVTGSWGALGEVIEVSSSDFQRNSLELFGYDFTHPQLKPLRDFFQNVRIGYIYRLGSGGVKAFNDHATALHVGTRGNDITVIVAANVDDPGKFDVSLLLDTSVIFKQTVSEVSELQANAFVAWSSAPLALTSGMPLAGGSAPVVANSNYQEYLDTIEAFSFNTIGCPSDDTAVKGLFAAFTKRMREEQGVKFQCVMYNPASNSDHEGVIDVLNPVLDTDANAYDAVYWVTGLQAGTNVNKSAMNRVYSGEYTLGTNYTQSQLEAAIKGGKFAFHRTGNTNIRVLADINSLVNLTLEKSEDFQQNQTIRVLDQIGNDIALLFNTKYMGVVPNDQDGRVSLWSDIVKYSEQLQTIRAIENFSSDNVTIAQGSTKRAVVVSYAITPVNAMQQLYMTVHVN
jgi:hypothetical protein